MKLAYTMTSMYWQFRLEFRQVSVPALLVFLGACQSTGVQEAEESNRAPSSVGNASQQPAAQPTATTLEDVQAALDQSDLNGALNRLDEYLPANPGDLDAYLLYGRLNLDFADQLIATGQGGGGVIPGLWADAEAAFMKVATVRSDDPATMAGLSRSRRMQSRNVAAWEAVEKALGAHPLEEMSAYELDEFGRAGLAVTIDAVTAGEPVPPAARAAQHLFEQAVNTGSTASALPLSDLLAWQGQQGAGREVLLVALRDFPEWGDALSRLKNLGGTPAQRVTDLERLRSEAGEHALLLWHLGEARYDQNFTLRQQGDYPKSHEALDRAEESFLRAKDLAANFAESCDAWLHLVRTARGWTLREEGRTDDAGAAFVTALAADTARLEPGPDAGTLNLGIYAIIDDHFQALNLKEARAFLRQVTALVDTNSDWMNNLGFACRDLGVATYEAGEREEARQLFEESWVAYSRTVELTPNDARLVNDRALISVYYLDDHWDLAERELHRAIELGTAALENLPENVTRAERDRAEEAVGDAWENLAYLDVIRRGRTDRAAGYLENSVRYFPKNARMGVLHIRQVLEAGEQDSATESP